MTDPKNEIDWKTIIRRIKGGKCTPVISYQISGHHFFDHEDVIRAWADEVGYPLADRNNLARVAQYASLISRDALSAKEEYLDFLKQRLLQKAKDQLQPDQTIFFLSTLENELLDLTFSEVAARMGYPHYDNELDNPLRILAELPLPIYLTSNFSTFMEDALKAAGKEPYTEVCYWYDDLRDDAPSIFEEDPDYEPSVEKPLVYHVHGLDAHPSSLVLAEDDYLDFLVKVSQDAEAIPTRVSQALADSSLLLLGYQLQGWDFRSIFRGLITTKRSSRRLLSLSIQLVPDPEGVEDLEDAQEYLERYFDNANFEIYWGDAQSFMQELWEQWES
jgi:hypothetical protein